MNQTSVPQPKILIVDDELENIRGIVRLLEKHGYTGCVGFADAPAAVDQFIAIKPDLVLLDWHMEPMNGLDVITALRKQFADTFIPPIIVLTADGDPETKRIALDAGVSDFLAKPLDQSEVLLRIRNLLRLRRLMEQVENEKQRLEEIVFERTAELRETNAELDDVQRQVIQQDRMRALAAMAGGVAHDFNNSLMVIRGFSELYGSNQPAECSMQDMRDAFDTVALAANDAAEVVRRLREFYHPFNSTDDERQMVALNKLIAESVELTKPKWETIARAAGLCIAVQLELQEDPIILAAPAEIREAMMNLIFNAVDAMPQGGRISIRTRLVGEHVCIDVQDNGTGMTEKTRQRCLEPFYTTKGDRGTGLGLSIIYGIVHRHEGSMRIESEINQGTCISILFPLSKATAPDNVATCERIDVQLDVLMVDDDPLICTVVSQYLEADNHKVTVARNACEAIEKFSSGNFDVVITDRVMPKMSGDQLAEVIRSIDPRVPIILLTGFETHRAPGDVNLLLNKPATMESVRSALRTVFNGSLPPPREEIVDLDPQLLAAAGG